MAWTLRARGQAIDGAFDGEYLGSIAVEGADAYKSWDIRVSLEALATLGLSLNSQISVGLRQACLRLATQRLEERLRSGDTGLGDGADTLWLMTEDVDEITALVSSKLCGYQEFAGPDLYCAAADPSDPTAVGKNGLRTLAPTSTALCIGCNLPAADFICSHLHHASVVGIPEIPARRVADILCDVGSESAANPSMCHTAGHACWVRFVEDGTAAVPPVSGLAIPEALDYLNLVWKTRFQANLISPPGLAKVAGLALPALSRSDFVARVSELADVIKMIQVPGDLVDGSGEPIPADHSLARLEAFAAANLSQAGADSALQAAQVLRSINSLRISFQHTGIRKPVQECMRALGLGYPPASWGESWDHVRGLVTQALGKIRDAVSTAD